MYEVLDIGPQHEEPRVEVDRGQDFGGIESPHRKQPHYVEPDSDSDQDSYPRRDQINQTGEMF